MLNNINFKKQIIEMHIKQKTERHITKVSHHDQPVRIHLKLRNPTSPIHTFEHVQKSQST